MKWKNDIIRCLVLVIILLCVTFIGIPAFAINTDNVTITVSATPHWFEAGYVEEPLDFTVTYMADTDVLIEWTKGYGANTTLILAKYTGYSENATDGYIVYNSTNETFNDTWVNWDTNAGIVYYTAWSYSADNVSANYSRAQLECPHVSTLAEQFTILVQQVAYMAILITLLVLSVIAFWKAIHVIFIACFAISLMLGLYSTGYLGGNETTPLTLSMGLVLILYSFLCAGLALRLIFWKGEEE